MQKPQSQELHDTTSFGFKTVEAKEKASLVGGVFSSVASRYDIMNDVMSGGLHRQWKRDMINRLRMKDGDRLLDLAGGTGDISFRFLEKAKQRGLDVHATVTDINPDMLEQGRQRAINKNILQGIDWNVVDAEAIPYDDCSFDLCTMAFGIRNVTHIDKALKEIHRVLKPGGQFVCLEFSHVEQPIIKHIYDWYSFTLIPQFGKTIGGDKEAYQYLVESIRMFPKKEAFAQMLRAAGFSQVSYDTKTFGVVALHTGWRV